MSEPIELHREVESKFRLPAAAELPDLTGCGRVMHVDDGRTTTLTATYFDTADLRLARNRITLRRREGGCDAGWHLKIPVAEQPLPTRDELRLPLSAGAADVVPEQLRDLVTAYARRAPLVPVATLRTERASRLLRGADGAPIAELTDDVVAVLDGERVSLRFREVELEALDATAEEFAALDAALVAGGAVPGEFGSKAVRALGPRAQGLPDVPEPRDLRPSDPAGEVLRVDLSRRVNALRRRDLGVRRREPDAVRQLLRALRDTRSLLHAFAPLVEPAWGRRLQGELRWLATSLREGRAEQLRREVLDDLSARLPALVAAGHSTSLVGALVDTEREHAHRTRQMRHPETTLRSDRYLDLLDVLVEACTGLPQTPEARAPADDVIPALVRESWHGLAAAASALDTHEQTWRALRRAARRTQVACQAATPVFGRPAALLAKRARRLVDLVGSARDAELVARECARLADVPDVAGPTGFSLGVLHEHARAEARAARELFPTVWAEVARKKYRRWLA